MAGRLDRRLHAAPRARSRRGRAAGRRDGGDLARLPRRVRLLHGSQAAVAGASRRRSPSPGRSPTSPRASSCWRRWASTRSTRPAGGARPAATAVWWAGPAIGAFNLIPVLPLDGGNVVTSVLDRFLPGRARSVMVYVSLALTADGGRGRRHQRRAARLRVLPRPAPRDAAAAAVRRPRASRHVAVRQGHGRAAQRRRGPGPARSPPTGLRRQSATPVVPQTLDGPGLRQLLAVLPRPLPYGDPWNEYVLTNLLVGAGEHREAAEYGAASYARQPQPLLAATIARAAGALGDADTAVAWLRAAADSGASRHSLATIIDQAPELSRRPHPTRRRRPAGLPPTGRLNPSRPRASGRGQSQSASGRGIGLDFETDRAPIRPAPRRARRCGARGRGRECRRRSSARRPRRRRGRSGRRARRPRRRSSTRSRRGAAAPRESIRSTSSWPG